MFKFFSKEQCCYIIALGVGCLAKFCFWRYYSLWVVPFFMFFILLKIMEGRSSKNCFWLGYLFGIGYFASSLYWVHLSFNCVGIPIVGIAANVVLILYIALYPALACFLTRYFFPDNSAFRNLFFACCWTLSEIGRGIIFTGFPWNLIGYATYDFLWFKQIASVVGIYGVSFVFMIIISLAINKKTFKYAGYTLITVLCYGWFRDTIDNFGAHLLPNNTNLTIVQPCIEQTDKLNRNMFWNHLNTHLVLSKLDETSKDPHVVIWPEAAINSFAWCYDNTIIDYISSHMQNENTYIFSGADRLDNNKKIYNSSVLLNHKGDILAIYDKKHLLPFGEFIPEFLLKCGMHKVTSGLTNFTPGEKSRVISCGNIPNFAAIICYESAFPQQIIENNTKPKWIVNITNDAWFANSDEIYQHLRTVVFRSIEEGIPIVRCANTGISCLIDCKGHIVEMLPENVCGVIKTHVPQKSIITIYSKIPNTVLFLVLMSFIAILLRYHRKFALKI